MSLTQDELNTIKHAKSVGNGPLCRGLSSPMVAYFIIMFLSASFMFAFMLKDRSVYGVTIIYGMFLLYLWNSARLTRIIYKLSTKEEYDENHRPESSH
ncbi:MAG: hypothetical protein KC713_06380 [Candidatus Omnitrophica bacterium]|nr:hypothetical protein [Candidatus Omnitrophota bacterium]